MRNGKLLAVVVLALNALWLARAAIREPAVGVLAAASAVAAIVVWKWQPPNRGETNRAAVAIAVVLIAGLIGSVLAMLWLGGRIWR